MPLNAFICLICVNVTMVSGWMALGFSDTICWTLPRFCQSWLWMSSQVTQFLTSVQRRVGRPWPSSRPRPVVSVFQERCLPLLLIFSLKAFECSRLIRRACGGSSLLLLFLRGFKQGGLRRTTPLCLALVGFEGSCRATFPGSTAQRTGSASLPLMAGGGASWRVTRLTE